MGRNEGLKFQFKIAKQYREYIGEDANVGMHGTDVATKRFSIECKQHKRVDLNKAVLQARAQNLSGCKIPILVSRDIGEDTLVILSFKDFLDIVKTIKDLEDGRT